VIKNIPITDVEPGDMLVRIQDGPKIYMGLVLCVVYRSHVKVVDLTLLVGMRLVPFSSLRRTRLEIIKALPDQTGHT